jgi:site-specific recombinase XerD
VSQENNQQPVPGTPEENQKLSLAFHEWRGVSNDSAGTQHAYNATVCVFLEFLGTASALEIDHRVIREFLNHLLTRGCSASSMERHRHGLRKFYKFLGLAGAVRFSPAWLISKRKLPSRLPRVPTEDEMEKLIAAAKTPQDLAIVEVAYAIGARVNELVNIRLEHLDLPEEAVVIRNGKGGKDRYVPLGSRAIGAIKKHLAITKHKSGYLFPGRSGKPLSTRAVCTILGKLSVRAGIPHVHPHSLRHAFATHLLNRGAGLREIQEMLGHASVSSTAKYTQIASSDLLKTHERFFPR